MEPLPSPMDDSESEPSQAAPADGPETPQKCPFMYKLAALLASVMVALLIAEIGLRFLTPMQLGYEYRDEEFTHPREFVRDETGNRHGFHDVDHGPKPPDVRRVILLGDSYVAARNVSIPETPGQRLQHHLNARSSRKYEVISLGHGGWGQREQLAALRRHGIPAEPDIIVTLFLSLNDVKDNSDALQRETREQRRTHQHRRPGHTRIRAQDAPLFIFRWSALNRLISHRLAYFLRDRTVAGIPVPYFVYAAEDDQQWQAAWAETEQLILQMKEAADFAGARYVLVAASTPHGVWGAEQGLTMLQTVYPGMKKRRWDLDKPDKRIEQFSQQHGIPFLTLEPLFRIETVGKGRRLHFQYGGHWNPAGDDLAAEYIAEFLLSLESPQNAPDEAARPSAPAPPAPGRPLGPGSLQPAGFPFPRQEAEEQ